MPEAQVVPEVVTTPFEQLATALPVVAPDRSLTVTEVPLSPPGYAALQLRAPTLHETDWVEQAAAAPQAAPGWTVRLPLEQLKLAIPCVVPELSLTLVLEPLVVAAAVPEQVCPPTVQATDWLLQSETVLQLPTAAAEPFVHVTVATPTVVPVLSWTELLLPLAPPA